MRHTTRILAAAVTVTVAAAAWFFLAPPQLGGRTSFVVVDGVSMRPGLRGGDLVVLRNAASYDVGQIVGYHSAELHRDVLHRIVGRQGDRFVFKGDNNSFFDSEHPTAAQLFGREWLRVPGAGALLVRLRAPRTAAVLAGVAVLLLLGAGGGASARRRRRRRADVERPDPPSPSRGGWLLPCATGLLAAGGAALAASLLVAAFAYTRPLTRNLVWADLYVQKGVFAQSARAPAGPVYPRGVVGPTDPVFLRLVRTLDVSFRYSVTAKAAAQLRGRAGLGVVLGDGAGWSRRLVLSPPHDFVGNRTIVHGRIDLRALRALVQAFEKQTGAHNTLYRVRLEPRVELRGSVAGRPLREVFAPTLAMTLDELRLALEPSSADPAQPSNALVRIQGGAGTRSEPRTMGAFGRKAHVASVRRAALLAAAGSLGVLALGGLLLLLARRGDRVSAIRRQYGNWVVDVVPAVRPPGSERRVATMEALARIAERYDRLILHERKETGDTFIVEEEGVVYRFDVEAPGRADAEPAAEPPALRPVHLPTRAAGDAS